MTFVSRETRHAAYIGLLQRWGRTLNLTSAGDASVASLEGHVADCLSMAAFLPADLDRLIDLGSGQGFPAIPLAIETGVAIELIEADRRKAAFLVTALATLGLRGTVHPMRIADARLPHARCVTARALASIGTLIAMTQPFLAPSGCGLFLKGPAAVAEVAALPDDPTLHVALLETGRPPSCLVKVTKLG